MSMFGQTQQTQNSGTSLFGQNQSTAPSQGNSNPFGAANQSSGGLFGSANQSGQFGANNANNSQSTSLFGAKNPTSTPPANNPPTNSLFGSNSTGNQPGQTGGLFGSSANKTPAQTSGGLFGTGNANTANKSSGSLFGSGSNTQGQPGGLFGSTNQGAQTGGLFGNQNKTGQTGGLFGGSNTSNQQPGGLLGNSNNNQQSGGLFGNSNNNQQSGGILGNSNNSQQSGSLFGNSINNQQSGGLFGSSSNNQQSGGLFGNNNNNQQSGGLFGNNNSQQSGGLFGNNNSQQSGGLFGNNNNQQSGSLFGNTNTQQSGLFANKPASGQGGLFSQNNQGATTSSSLFTLGSTGINHGNNQGDQNGKRALYATVDQASFTLPGVTPSPKLYSSLTQKPKAKVEKPEVSTLANPQPVAKAAIPAAAAKEPECESIEQPKIDEPRKFMNSYDRFLAERPTNLVIKRRKIELNPRKNVATLTRLLPVQPSPSNALDTKNAENKGQLEMTNTDTLSIFSQNNKDITVVKVNKKALSQGYFVRPSLDEILGYTKKQLSSVQNLIIGRTDYGQIEYVEPVDLTSIKNLGDILGTFVVFDRGQVSVYPEGTSKASVGEGLNKPAVITLEQIYPLDQSHRPITDNADPRVEVFVKRLKKLSKDRGAEFITYTRGLWVFKVPHFSVWGLTPEEMVVDDSDEAMENDDEPVEASDMDEGNGPTRTNEENVVKRPKNQVLPLSLTGPVSLSNQSTTQASSSGSNTEVVPHENKKLEGSISSVPKFDTWLSVFENSNDSFLGASDNVIETLSRNAGKVDASVVTDLFFNTTEDKEKAKIKQEFRIPERSHFFRSSDMLVLVSSDPPQINPIRLPVKPLKFDLNTIRKHTQRSTRRNGLKKFVTTLTFDVLQSLEDNPLWSVAALLFENSTEITRLLGSWLQSRVSVPGSFSNVYDEIWANVCAHRLSQAAEGALKIKDMHLATAIACLSDRKSQENAKQNLRYLVESGQIYDMPVVVRKVLEVASGNLGHAKSISDGTRTLGSIDILEGLDWEHRLGMNIWYGPSDLSIQNLIGSTVLTCPDISSPELAMLKFVGRPDCLPEILSLVDDTTAFLLLQTLRDSKSRTGSQVQEVADALYHNLSFSFAEEGRISWAIFVALHVDDDSLAYGIIRSIVLKSPDLPPDVSGDVPESLLYQSKALYAHYKQNYAEEVQYLLKAGDHSEAHKIFIRFVAPRAVIEGNLSDFGDVLRRFPQNVDSWYEGGYVYLKYAEMLETPTQSLGRTLGLALAKLPLPSLEIRAAASVMSELVTRHADDLTTAEIMAMPLGPELFKTQAPLRALADL